MTASGGLDVVQTEHSVEIVADLERRRLEALVLELRSFARRYGLELRLDQGGPGNGRPAGAGDTASAR